MTWVSALQPWQWALLAVVPLGIVLLYFLKLRREPVEIPSTFLWARTIEDLHVNSLFQRLRQNALLLLQLLLVALAAVALLRPSRQAESARGDRTIFLLDVSASMGATDAGRAGSRFERAREMIDQQIDQMQAGEAGMLVTFCDRAEVLQPFTQDRGRLRAALARAELTGRPTDITAALEAAEGLATERTVRAATGREAETDSGPSDGGSDGEAAETPDDMAQATPASLMIFSDGNVGEVDQFDARQLIPEYLRVGAAACDNVAITTFSADRNAEDPEQAQAYATVSNFGDARRALTVSLYVDGTWRDSTAVSLEPAEESGLSFSLSGQREPATLELRLERAERSGATRSSDMLLDDDLASDNVAYAGLRPLQTVSVLLVSEGNQPLELGLSTERAAKRCVTEVRAPSYLESNEYAARAQAGLDDLIIYDRCRPKTLPETNTFFLGRVPPDGRWSWSGPASQVIVIDVDRTHPLMRYLDLYSLLIYRGRPLQGPVGTKPLIVGDTGTVLALAPRDSYQDLVLGFEIVSRGEGEAPETNTNWYAERSWPVFLLNVLRHLAGAAEVSNARNHLPGDTVRLRVPRTVAEVDIARGDDAAQTVPVAAAGSIEFVQTDRSGAYRVSEGDQLIDLFSVNLLSRSESQIKPRETLQLGYERLQSAGTIQVRKEYWRYLLVAALAVLMVEWWLYQKRIA